MKQSKNTKKQLDPLFTKRIGKVILAAAIALLILGIAQNGQADVRNKAVRICYECIGIG